MRMAVLDFWHLLQVSNRHTAENGILEWKSVTEIEWRIRNDEHSDLWHLLDLFGWNTQKKWTIYARTWRWSNEPTRISHENECLLLSTAYLPRYIRAILSPVVPFSKTLPLSLFWNMTSEMQPTIPPLSRSKILLPLRIADRDCESRRASRHQDSKKRRVSDL